MSNPKRIVFMGRGPRDTELPLNVFNQYHVANEIVALRGGDYLYRSGEFAGGDDEMSSLVLPDLKMPGAVRENPVYCQFSFLQIAVPRRIDTTRGDHLGSRCAAWRCRPASFQAIPSKLYCRG